MAERALNSLAVSVIKLTSQSVNLINYQSVRTRIWTNVRPIMGWPRKHLFLRGKKYPEPHKYNWRPYLPEDGSYTIRPLPIFKMGGRDLETGRVVVRTLGGGNPKKFRWVDNFRTPNEDGSIREETVLQIKYDPLHSPRLALVADQERMRWIHATHNINVGDVIRTHSEIPRNPVKPVNGDAYPIGSLPTGTKIHSIEINPGEGAKFCLVAGSSAEIVKRTNQVVTIKLPNGDTFKVEPTCMVVAGQLSNVGMADVQLWCPQRKRWLGKRPRSGQWHRKDGYCGKKTRMPRIFDYTFAAMAEKHAEQSKESMFEL